MSPEHLKNLRIPRNQPEDREGFYRTRRPGGRHLGHSGGWKNIEVNHTQSAIHFPIQQKPQTRRLEGYGSSSSAPPTCNNHSPGVRVFINTPTQTPQISRSSICISIQFQQSSF
ncbi:hypothetical protein O181_098782 [Austropuccinia psidii MF-1]|uniref:Uncharacterized protein n=1 Tax=Austropuccinia psidii MF-1 TaxID=1389203 RepID=A0A9Q3JBY6_9BASI|nr:hypothetical protein [Austropuccinia psidii MF-1]